MKELQQIYKLARLNYPKWWKDNEVIIYWWQIICFYFFFRVCANNSI